MNKIQNFKQNRFDHLKLEFGIYLGFGIWVLGFKSFLKRRDLWEN
jgi:hypothetical protein